MTSHEIRKAFLDFFRSKGHLIVPSAPLVAKNDPTLMFNNSGMAQFKDFFLGNGTPPAKRIADTQKCLRVSGKHNDLEEVGFDTYHHTMFEMLGNWSFGDYFKKEALAWSWELLTEVYKLPKDRIYVSVFEGSKEDNVPFDQEAFDIWKELIGDENRIILGNKKDNFWEMGDTGPCGPCSEIHIDLRSQEEVDQKSGKELVNNDHPQVVEIWNNVFMQFERKWNEAKGGNRALNDFEQNYTGEKDDTFKKLRAAKHSEVTQLVELPAKHVDTGMGFERLCMAIQGKQSNYDTDVFQNTIKVLEEMSDKKYGEHGTLSSNSYVDVAMRVIADHIRAVAFTIADGQLPSNNKAGYVIRRILRRAVRYGYSYLGFKEPFMNKLVPVLANQFADVFPELKSQQDFVSKVIEEEEKTFLRTLETGLKRLDAIMSITSGNVIVGEQVFELSDTFGFPLDLTALIAKEKGFGIDQEGFNKALQVQKNLSKKDSTKEATDWIELNEGDDFEFVGYDQLSAEAHIVKYRRVKTKAGEEYHIVLDRTPFYAEMGGQVGDTGTIVIGNHAIKIADTKKENDLFVHIAREKDLDEILKDATIVVAHVDEARHSKIMANHTATHLMLAAMREVLGSHIVQKGSYQDDSVTRFDFSHFAKVTDEELAKIEDIVNAKIRQNIALETKVNMPINEAIALGATATFGEKYGDFVRVVIFDPQFSVELCGGTHVPSTGQIGIFKFVSEGSVAAGVRRVEALTGEKAIEKIKEDLRIKDEIASLLKNPADLLKAVETLIADKAALQKKVEVLENEKLQGLKKQLIEKVEAINGINVLTAKVSVPSADALKQLAFELRNQVSNFYGVLGAEIGGKPQIAVIIDEDVMKEKNLHAGNIVKELAKEMKGGGGGQPYFATAGGSDLGGLDKAIEKGKSLI